MRLCRWLGHRWVSTITGNPIDRVVDTGGEGYVKCSRCGAKP